jgi:Zn finger protein HypA/HybF involved in hydrogenase expression
MEKNVEHVFNVLISEENWHAGSMPHVFQQAVLGYLTGTIMPIGYDYCCQRCRHEWTLCSKHFMLGPVQWGESRYTCLTCQTFLTIATSVDANSWSIWRRNHKSEIDHNATLSQLAESVEHRLSHVRGLTPIELHFDSIECPNCHDAMSTVTFGEHLMKCPKCGQFAGEFDDSSGISVYGHVAEDAENTT